MRFSSLLEPGQHSKTILVAIGVGLLYLFLSVNWFLFSGDIVANLAVSQNTLEIIQHYKWLAFTSFMSILIAMLVYKVYQHGILMEKALYHIRTDMVTGLANRAVAEEFLSNQLKKLNRDRQCCGIILFDILGLKRINLSVGRSGGDHLLREVGQRIHKGVRPIDLVARLESDTILVVLGRLVNEKEAVMIGQKILLAFNSPINVKGLEVQTELLGVIATAPKDGRSAFELLDASERALHRSRSKKGKNCLELVNKEDTHNDFGHLEREARLRHAIRKREFTLALQPQVKLDTLELTGAEALIRWHSPERGYIPPGEFIPLAESLGLIQEITKQVLEAVGYNYVNWNKKGLSPIRVSINFSGLDLKNGRILDIVKSVLDSSHIPGYLLTIEITESWLMEDSILALGLIQQLRKLGPRLAIDDFGTGYSALSQLIDFPFDFVKFDRSFISGVDRSHKKARILADIQRLCNTLGAKTVAEGIESIPELAILGELGIDEAQGFLLSKPLTVSQLESMLLEQKQPPFSKIRDQLEMFRKTVPKKSLHMARLYELRGLAQPHH